MGYFGNRWEDGDCLDEADEDTGCCLGAGLQEGAPDVGGEVVGEGFFFLELDEVDADAWLWWFSSEYLKGREVLLGCIL